MKKIFSVILSTIMLFAVTVQAKIGDKVDVALNTDIVAYINNYAIPSFAVNGTSCIVAEDLRNFGFDVAWNDGARSLTISRNANTTVNPMSFSKTAKTGSYFADILETDISVYADLKKITSYAMNGYTMIPVEELTMFGLVNWVDGERALKLWVDGLHIRETMQPVEKKQVESSWHEIYNGRYKGGGTQYYNPYIGAYETIGAWGATLSNVTENSMHISFGQSESDYGVDMTLYRQPDGSYYGYGISSWGGYSYIKVWLETKQRISVTVSGSCDAPGTEILYRTDNY